MRKVIWIAGAVPKDMSDAMFLHGIQDIAKATGGEVCKFGESSYLIIGDEQAENNLKAIQADAEKQLL